MHTCKTGYNNDSWIGHGQGYTVSGGLQWLSDAKPTVPWFHVTCNRSNLPKHSFIFWLRSHNRLLTKDRLKRFGIFHDEVCYLCVVDDETHTHLFYDCQYSSRCCMMMQNILGVRLRPELLQQWIKSSRGRSRLQQQIVGACHVALVYAIWEARNHARHHDSVVLPRLQVKNVINRVIQRFWATNTTRLSDKEIIWIEKVKCQL
ncbi:uncharacterized protein LOC141627828 [Silene latifolia]|uniref:uncharacterized protein LOC141627828 n=1 Tax=Silene latifolia TaxID=37657 RepID=UPI003D7744D8